jgi:branched-chain amino acid aminotransferase
MEIKITRTRTKFPKEKPQGSLGFGKIFTDHMFIMDYENGGWHNARIIPYGDMTISPASAVFHYGQETFEGLKAYKNNSCYLFRPEMNARRINASNVRMCIPEIPEEIFLEAVKTLIQTDMDWIPETKDSSLYIRPFFIAADPFLGVAVSKTYRFIIIMTPCGAYFGNKKPVGIWVENEYVRAVRGGTGCAKTGGNYAASLAALERAQKEGYAQVMWLDGVERKYIEEVGSMNIFFKIDGKIVTPSLNGSILNGITRDSVITLCREFGFTVEERLVSIDELIDESCKLEEVFGTGTAAVITPVNKFRYGNKIRTVGNGETGAVSRKLYDTLTAIQRGNAADKYGWRVQV